MKKTIGIIGGMGPLATVDLFKKIVIHTKAEKDSDHIRVLIDCNGRIPDRTASILHNAPSPVPYIVETANKLADSGADFLIIPCVTSHYYFDEVRSRCHVPILNMLEETMVFLENKGLKKAFLFATTGTIKTGIYDSYSRKHGIELIVPESEDQQQVMNLIYDGVKKGNLLYDTAKIRQIIEGVCSGLHLPIILGCTELPLAVEMYGLKGDFIDTTLILAKKAIEYAGYEQV